MTDTPHKFVPTGLSLEEFYEQRKAKAKKILSILQYSISDLSDKILLDIGCHEGTITTYLAKSFKDTKGIDIDLEAINIAQKHNSNNIEFLNYNGELIPFQDNYFDVLVVNHVIYYVNNQSMFLKEINRVLKKGGVCYISAINKFYVNPPIKLPNNLWETIRRSLLKSADNFGNPSSYEQYLNMFHQFKIEDYTLKVLTNPDKYAVDIKGWQKLTLVIISKSPFFIRKFFTRLSPTYIFMLFKE